MRRIKLIRFLLLGLILSGCATVELKNNFYGIGMNSVKDAKDFKIISNSEGEISYNKNNRTMNPDIYAWASADGPYVLIRVANKSNNPIDTNYFSNDFELIDKEGRTFKMEKDDLTLYHGVSFINPGQTGKFLLKNPFNYDEQRLKSETAMIVCTLGSLSDRVTIVLKPLPEEQNTPTNKK